MSVVRVDSIDDDVTLNLNLIPGDSWLAHIAGLDLRVRLASEWRAAHRGWVSGWLL